MEESFMQGTDRDYSEWLKKAHHDELSIGAILLEEHGAPSTACFLSQQMAEKLLKGALVFLEEEYPRVHDLLYLESLLLTHIQNMAHMHTALDFLNRFSVEGRYPGDYEESSFAEARKAFSAALEIKTFVIQEIQARSGK